MAPLRIQLSISSRSPLPLTPPIHSPALFFLNPPTIKSDTHPPVKHPLTPPPFPAPFPSLPFSFSQLYIFTLVPVSRVYPIMHRLTLI